MFQKIIYTTIIILLHVTFLYSQNYTLVWSDEFVSDILNTAVWTHETGGGGWGNNELQYYTDRPDNAYVEDGKLIIEAKEESFGGRNYTSARLISKNKKSFRYGKIEAKIKLPYGQGIWPAFWMMGQSYDSVNWPYCGEIDIMELVGGAGKDNVSHGTVHWYENGHASYGGSYVLANGIFADDYHIFGIEWTPQKIVWKVDGNSFKEIDITPAGLSEFHQEFFFLLNVAVGGDWPGSPDPNTVFPQKMYVDYVRVYQNTEYMPDVIMTSPSNGAVFNEGDNIEIVAGIMNQTDIKEVVFYQGEKKIGKSDFEPYSMTWRNVMPGCYKIKAVAVTKEGYTGSTEQIEVKVGDNCVEASYQGKPITIPGKIEAEDFNLGEPGEAYYDSDAGNSGSAYRITDNVDIQECSDTGGGYNIGWTAPGEWMDYFVNVLETGTYELIFRIASESTGGSVNVLVDGVQTGSSLTFASTGDWQEYQDVILNDITLEAGFHTVRINIESGEFNLNYVNVLPPDAEKIITVLFPDEGDKIYANSITDIMFHNLLVNEIMIGITYDAGVSWDFITSSTSTEFGYYRWKVPDFYAEQCKIMIIDKEDNSVKAESDGYFTIDITSSTESEGEMPEGFFVEQNYPNPFNPETKIRMSIPDNVSSNLDISVYDNIGNKIKNIANGNITPGIYEYSFNGENLASGIYYFKVTDKYFSKTIKMLLLK